MRLSPRKPVTDRSITSLKRRALRRSKTLARDSETLEPIQPSFARRMWDKVYTNGVKAPFTKVWWEDRLEQTDEEELVDAKLLSYAYLEAGMIETLGS